MLPKLTVILLFAGLMAAVFFFCMRATPRRGYMRVIERVCMGIILCYLCGLALAPFGIRLAQGPISAASAGYFGLPGVALGVISGLWP